MTMTDVILVLWAFIWLSAAFCIWLQQQKDK